MCVAWSQAADAFSYGCAYLRYYLVQRAREAGIIGIVVGTLGVKHYGNVVRSLRRMVEDEGRKAYTLAVGKINVAKLANFAEVRRRLLAPWPRIRSDKH